MTFDFVILDNQTAYATATRNVDFNVPGWVNSIVFHWDISAVAGTTPIADLKFQMQGPLSAQFRDLRGASFGQQTAATRGMYLAYGPHMVDQAGDGANKTVQGYVPLLMRAVFVFDRTTGNETYTYTLAAQYKS